MQIRTKAIVENPSIFSFENNGPDTQPHIIGSWRKFFMNIVDEASCPLFECALKSSCNKNATTWSGKSYIDVDKNKDFKIKLIVNNTNVEWKENLCYECSNSYGQIAQYPNMVVGYKILPNPTAPVCTGF